MSIIRLDIIRLEKSLQPHAVTLHLTLQLQIINNH